MAEPTLDDKLSGAEKRNGLPAGLLRSIIKQETGGSEDYITDPSKYHYAANAEGKRIAGHTGKVSTAFGPFGILESTGSKPGYGVAPLQNKTIDEQIRFASDYVAARKRSAGSLEAGLAGYGEGSKYSKQVMGRLGAADSVPAVAPVPSLTAPPSDSDWPRLPTARGTGEKPVDPRITGLLATAGAEAIAASSPDISAAQTQKVITGAEDLQRQRDATGLGAVVDSARHDPRLQPMFTALDWASRETEVPPEGWTYAANKDDIEKGYSDDEREYLRENVTGPQTLQAAQAQLSYRRELDKSYGLAGGFTAFTGQMVGGMQDPLGFAMGMGAGKALSAVGIGSRALAMASRPGAAAASFYAENALANISVEAMQDAMGEVKTSADYAMAGAAGVAMALPFTRGAIRGGLNESAMAQVGDMRTKAVTEQMDAVTDQLNTGASPSAAVKAVQDNELNTIMNAVREGASISPTPRRESLVPQDLLNEQRRMLDGTPEVLPQMDHPRNPPELTDVVNEVPTLTDEVNVIQDFPRNPPTLTDEVSLASVEGREVVAKDLGKAKNVQLEHDPVDSSFYAVRDGKEVGNLFVEAGKDGKVHVSDMGVDASVGRQGIMGNLFDEALKRYPGLTFETTALSEDGFAFARKSKIANTINPEEFTMRGEHFPRETLNLHRVTRPDFDWNRSKPQGMYASIVDDKASFKSPFAEEKLEGAVDHSIEYTPTNPLVPPATVVTHKRFGNRKSGDASAGVAALKAMLPPAEFDAALRMTKDEVNAAINERFPGVDTSRPTDSYESLEIWGAQEAKKAGHDVIIYRDTDIPDFSEAVLLQGLGEKPLAYSDNSVVGLWDSAKKALGLHSEVGGVTLSWKVRQKPNADHTNIGGMLDIMLVNTKMSPSLRAAANYFRAVGSDDVLAAGVRLTRDSRGSFDPNIQRVNVPSRGTGTTVQEHLAGLSPVEAQVALHEVGHALTHSKIEAWYKDPGSLPPALRAALDQLDNLSKRYSTELANRRAAGAPVDGGAYATTNLHEFAAEAWTRREVREVLKGMEGEPVAGIPSSAWREFVNVLARVLGLRKNDGLREATQLLDVVLHTDANIVHNNGGPALMGPPPAAAAAFRRKYAEGVVQNAQAFMAGKPINLDKLQTATAKLGGLSDGLTLARSKNPVLQMIASLVTETTTGAAGRGETAAIKTQLLKQKLIGNAILDYDASFDAWGKDNQLSLRDKLIGGDGRRKFDKLVYTEILNRRDANYQAHSDLSVVRAADAAEGSMDRGRIAQVDAGTLGSDRLAASSVGYVPQALDGTKLQAISSADLDLLHQALARQFETRLGWNKTEAELFAPYYTERIRKRSQGSNGVDVVSGGGDAGQVIRDTLEDMMLDPNLRDRAAAAAAKIGQGHTKGRLDLDLREQLRPGLQLMDLYQTDTLSLVRSYSHRTAGHVALAENGILGIQGVNQLRDAAGTPVAGVALPTAKEFDAFDRVFAELLGTPVAGRVVSAGATNLGMAMSLQRMGSLVFTQAAETFQLATTLGLNSLMGGVASLPRMMGEVGRIKKGQAPGNNVLSSIETVGGVEFGAESYKMVAPLDTPDNLVGQYVDQAGLFTRLLRAGGHLQSKISFFRGLMAAQHRATAEQIVSKAMRYINEGKNDVNLADMGYTPQMAALLKAEMPNIATFDGSGKLLSLDLSKVSDPRIAEGFIQATHRGVSQIIQGTFVGERNAWAHNDWLRLMTQLRTFGLTATEKQWGRQRMNHGYGKAAGMLLGQLAFALPIHLARIQLAAAGREDRDKYIKDNMTPAALTRSVTNYASMSGLTGDVLDVLSAIAGGWGGNEVGEMVGARQQAMGIGRIIPAAGTVDRGLKVVTGKADLHTALKQLPFSNLWYLLPLLNIAKDD